MMEAEEYLRSQTQAFINDDPTDVVLVRQVRTDDGAGGYRNKPTPLDPQTVRIVPQRQGVTVSRTTVNGQTVNPQNVMLCAWDADVKVGDSWKDDVSGISYEVVWVTPLPYEKLAELWGRG